MRAISKTFIGFASSLCAADATHASDCDICGNPPTTNDPTVSLESTRIEKLPRKHNAQTSTHTIHVHKACVNRVVDSWISGYATTGKKG